MLYNNIYYKFYILKQNIILRISIKKNQISNGQLKVIEHFLSPNERREIVPYRNLKYINPIFYLFKL